MQSNKNRKVGIANRPIFPIKVKNPKQSTFHADSN